MPVPATARLLALLLAVIVAGVDLQRGTQLYGEDPVVASGHLLVGLLFVTPLLWIALFPESAGAFLVRRMRLDLSKGGHVGAATLHIAFAYLVFGQTLLATAEGLSTLLATGENPALGQDLPAGVVIGGLVINLVLFGLAAWSWVSWVEGRIGVQAAATLGFDRARLPVGVGYGLAMAVAVLSVMGAIGYVLDRSGAPIENPLADAIAASLTPATALAVAGLAAVGEELYFRGFLLPRVGNLTQALLFSLLHATYLTPLQVIFPFALGLVFGWLRPRTGVWGPIVGHASINAAMLLAAIYAGSA